MSNPARWLFSVFLLTGVRGWLGQERQGCLEEREHLTLEWEDLVPAPGHLTCQALEKMREVPNAMLHTEIFRESMVFLGFACRQRSTTSWSLLVLHILSSLASPLGSFEIFHVVVKRKCYASKCLPLILSIYSSTGCFSLAHLLLPNNRLLPGKANKPFPLVWS